MATKAKDYSGFATEEVAFGDTLYTIRELTVGETDEIEDATEKVEGRAGARLYTRLCLSTAIVSPPTTVDDIADWPITKSTRLVAAYNRLNVVYVGGNAPGPLTSSGPTSPTSGEPSQST